MTDAASDAELSREITEHLNATAPTLVADAAKGRSATAMLLTASAIAVAVATAAAIFGPALSSTVFILILIALLAVIGVLLATALAVGTRAKRAWVSIESDVAVKYGAELVRIADGEVTVRRTSRT